MTTMTTMTTMTIRNLEVEHKQFGDYMRKLEVVQCTQGSERLSNLI